MKWVIGWTQWRYICAAPRTRTSSSGTYTHNRSAVITNENNQIYGSRRAKPSDERSRPKARAALEINWRRYRVAFVSNECIYVQYIYIVAPHVPDLVQGAGRDQVMLYLRCICARFFSSSCNMACAVRVVWNKWSVSAYIVYYTYMNRTHCVVWLPSRCCCGSYAWSLLANNNVLR